MTIRNTLANTAKAAGIVAFALLSTACASTQSATETSAQADAATHYWQSKRQADATDYDRDNSHCGQQSDVSTANPMAYDSESFEIYRQCMIERGYVLRTY